MSLKWAFMDKKLAGQTALITGAGSGIGRAIAVEMAKHGANIVINYHSDEAEANDVAQAVEDWHVQALTVKADVGQENEVIRMFSVATEKFGTIDILVNNAGIQKDSSFLTMTLSEWNAVMTTNLTGQFLCAREAAKEFIRRGATGRTRAIGNIIFISSVHNVIPWAGHANYVASKGGEEMFMKSIAQELAAQKIRVNSISPGAIKTDINKSVWGDPEKNKKLLELIPYGRIGEPDDVAKLAAWLASDDSDYITGANIYIDGGMTLYPSFLHNG
jgi:glucose 1-dehydrogenase